MLRFIKCLFWGLFGYRHVYRTLTRAGERVRIDEWYHREDRVPRSRIHHLIHWLEGQGFKEEQR